MIEKTKEELLGHYNSFRSFFSIKTSSAMMRFGQNWLWIIKK